MVFNHKLNLKLLILFLNVYVINFSFSQSSIDYSINASLLTETDQLIIKQNISFFNQDDLMNKIFLNDWANSYSSTKSPLAERLVEEYTRSFYLSAKSKRGYTLISNIFINDSEANWKRSKNNPDIIELTIDEPLKKGIVNIDLSYIIKIPSSKFTGYGKIKRHQYFIENFFISLSKFNKKKQVLYSNLDLEEVPINESKFRIDLKIDKNLSVYSSLDLKDYKYENAESLYTFESNKIKQVIFLIGDDLNIKEFNLDEKLTNINIDLKDFKLETQKNSLKNIFQFIKSIDAIDQPTKVFITKEKYAKRPFYGLSIMPTFLNSFSMEQKLETSDLQP